MFTVKTYNDRFALCKPNRETYDYFFSRYQLKYPKTCVCGKVASEMHIKTCPSFQQLVWQKVFKV